MAQKKKKSFKPVSSICYAAGWETSRNYVKMAQALHVSVHRIIYAQICLDSFCASSVRCGDGILRNQNAAKVAEISGFSAPGQQDQFIAEALSCNLLQRAPYSRDQKQLAVTGFLLRNKNYPAHHRARCLAAEDKKQESREKRRIYWAQYPRKSRSKKAPPGTRVMPQKKSL